MLPVPCKIVFQKNVVINLLDHIRIITLKGNNICFCTRFLVVKANTLENNICMKLLNTFFVPHTV